jgi:ribose transport system substrate-binding protein
MKKKLLAVLLAGLMAGSLFAGGGRQQTQTGGYKFPVIEKKDVVIGFNNGSTTVDFLRLVGDSMVRAAAANGVKILVAESAFDTERIIHNVDNLLLRGANIIVDFNVNAEVGGSLVDYCGQRGVPVIGVDVMYTGARGDEGWFFGADNQMAGETAGRGLAQAVKAKWGGQIDYLLLFFNSENGDLVKKRLSGIYDGLLKEGISVDQRNVAFIDMGGGGSDTTLAGNEKMTNWLTAHPNLRRIGVGTVNCETGQGVFSAVQTANRDSQVLIVTNNNSNQTLAAFQLGDNAWVGGSAFFPNRYGEYIVPLCIDILAGKNPGKIQTVKHEFLGRNNIREIRAEAGL